MEKKNYSKPQSKVIELDFKDGLLEELTSGSAVDEFDVKASRRGFSWDDEDED